MKYIIQRFFSIFTQLCKYTIKFQNMTSIRKLVFVSSQPTSPTFHTLVTTSLFCLWAFAYSGHSIYMELQHFVNFCLLSLSMPSGFFLLIACISTPFFFMAKYPLCCRYTTFLTSWQTLGCFLWAITEIVVMNVHV